MSNADYIFKYRIRNWPDYVRDLVEYRR